jgi:hypothetical protein
LNIDLHIKILSKKENFLALEIGIEVTNPSNTRVYVTACCLWVSAIRYATPFAGIDNYGQAISDMLTSNDVQPIKRWAKIKDRDSIMASVFSPHGAWFDPNEKMTKSFVVSVPANYDIVQATLSTYMAKKEIPDRLTWHFDGQNLISKVLTKDGRTINFSTDMEKEKHMSDQGAVGSHCISEASLW